MLRAGKINSGYSNATFLHFLHRSFDRAANVGNLPHRQENDDFESKFYLTNVGVVSVNAGVVSVNVGEKPGNGIFAGILWPALEQGERNEQKKWRRMSFFGGKWREMSVKIGE